jgi:hypothetical protein
VAAAVQTSESIRIVGLTEFVAELKLASPAFARELSAVHRTIAKTIRDDAQAMASGLGSTAAHVAPSLRASGTQRAASIFIGSDAYPMALGAEFGSIGFHQFKAWRGSGGDAGYFLYPTIRNHQDETIEEFSLAVQRVAAHAFPD